MKEKCTTPYTSRLPYCLLSQIAWESEISQLFVRDKEAFSGNIELECNSVGRRVPFWEVILVGSLIGRKLRRSYVILEQWQPMIPPKRFDIFSP